MIKKKKENSRGTTITTDVSDSLNNNKKKKGTLRLRGVKNGKMRKADDSVDRNRSRSRAGIHSKKLSISAKLRSTIETENSNAGCSQEKRSDRKKRTKLSKQKPLNRNSMMQPVMPSRDVSIEVVEKETVDLSAPDNRKIRGKDIKKQSFSPRTNIKADEDSDDDIKKRGRQKKICDSIEAIPHIASRRKELLNSVERTVKKEKNERRDEDPVEKKERKERKDEDSYDRKDPKGKKSNEDDDMKFDRKFKRKKPLKKETQLTPEMIRLLWKNTPLEKLCSPQATPELDPWEADMEELEKRSMTYFSPKITVLNTTISMFQQLADPRYRQIMKQHIASKAEDIRDGGSPRQRGEFTDGRLKFDSSVRRTTFSVKKETKVSTDVIGINDLPTKSLMKQVVDNRKPQGKSPETELEKTRKGRKNENKEGMNEEYSILNPKKK